MSINGVPTLDGPDPSDAYDSLVRAASEGIGRIVLRHVVTVVASAFLFVYVSVAAGAVWVAFTLGLELVGVVIRRRVRNGDRGMTPFYIGQVFIVSLAWMTHATLLWGEPDLIARIAAVVDVFTVALYAAIGAHTDKRLLAALLAPPLVTLIGLLVPMSWAQGQPAGALVATVATFGAAMTLAGNAMAMHRSDRELTAAVRALARERAELERRVEARTAALADAAARAEAASDAKARFLAALTHELRTPLNAIIGYAEILGDELRTARETASPEDADRILANGLRLLALLNGAIEHAAEPKADLRDAVPLEFEI